MKDVGFYIGSFSTAGVGVFQMTNFNPFTISFYATLTGIFLFSLIVGVLGAAFFGRIKKQVNQWRGIGQTHSRDLLLPP